MGHTARYLKALPVVLLLAPLAQSLACDVAVLKGDATADGSVILVGLYEWQPTPGEPYPIMHVDRKQYEPGATVKLSFRTIPQVRQTWAYNYVHSRFRTKGKAKDFDLAVPSAAHAINEWGVAIASTSIYKGKVDGDQPDGVDFFDINRLVPERCKTAEAGAKLIGEMIGKYGYPSRAKDNDHGQVWVVADPHDAWVVECGGGRHWVARKIREDFYNCSNAPTITNAFDRGSEVVRYALDKGWIDKPEEFHWSRHFAAGAYQWKKRLAAVRNYLTAPDRFGRITPDTIKKMLRADEVGGVASIRITQAAIIAHLRDDVPQTLRAKAWIATRTPHANNLFLPTYAASKVGLPSELAAPGCEYWFAKRDNLSDKARAAFENWADARATDLEKRVKQDLGEGRPRTARQRIQDYHQKIVARALDVYRSKE